MLRRKARGDEAANGGRTSSSGQEPVELGRVVPEALVVATLELAKEVGSHLPTEVTSTSR